MVSVSMVAKALMVVATSGNDEVNDTVPEMMLGLLLFFDLNINYCAHT